MNDQNNNSKSPIVWILGLVALLLVAGIIWLVTSGGGSEVSSELMSDTTEAPADGGGDGGTTDTGDTTAPPAGDFDASAIGETEGLKFRVGQREFYAIGSADPQTKGTLDAAIPITFGAGGNANIEADPNKTTPAYLPALPTVLQIMTGSVEDGTIEITDEKVTIDGTVPNAQYAGIFQAVLSAENGFTQEIENNLVVQEKAFSRVELVNTDGVTVVTGALKNQALADQVTQESKAIFGEATEVNVTVDEGLYAGYSWSRYGELVGGMRAFQNWEAGSVNNNPYATIREGLNFASGSASLDAASQQRIAGLLPIMLSSSSTIFVTGHTDSDGADAANQTLSEARAETVRQTLIGAAAQATGSDSALAPERVQASGSGESSPIATNDTSEGKALNRRVEFSVDRGQAGQ